MRQDVEAASTSFHTDKFGEPDSGYTNGNWQDVHNTLPSNPNVQNNELIIKFITCTYYDRSICR